MQFISGHFIGKYKGKEVDPLKIKTLSALHFLNIESGAEIKSCQWINDYRSLEFREQRVNVPVIRLVDLHFDNETNPGQKPFRENIYDCVLVDPHIHTILRKKDYTYGTIEGKIFGVIPAPEQQKSQVKVLEPIAARRATTNSTLPIGVEDKVSVWKPEKIGTWGWGIFFSALAWILLLFWLLSWLINHRGCSTIPKRADFNPPKTDTIIEKKGNDSLVLMGNNLAFSVYDWYVEDHDTINLFLNGRLIKENLELNKRVISWSMDKLPAGDNLLKIESVNNGTVGPASPTIEINDGVKTLWFKTSVYKGSPKTFHLILK